MATAGRSAPGGEALEHAEPIIVGQFVAEADQSHRQRRFIEPSRWERLQHVIAERDPEGRFAGYLCQDRATLNQP